jgi:hypothetical protein
MLYIIYENFVKCVVCYASNKKCFIRKLSSVIHDEHEREMRKIVVVVKMMMK